MENLKTTIGLEIHVQLATKSKMFCRCNNDAQGKEPNSVVCPVCLGMPGALPVANCQAIEWTIKTGLVLNCEIPKIAKFDRKHYFYPDLPKGYQISQYDEPFAINGSLSVQNNESGIMNNGSKEEVIRINRVHLEEDAGKLIHKDGKSLVDLNRAGTPLMEIVTEPDITSPEMAREFLRKLQKIVRDEVQVSEASMEKGHLRCDANISLCEMQDTITKGQSPNMSQIIEIKNINSFKFVEKALARAEEKLRAEYPNWPEKLTKETWGYDSVKDEIYLQRKKEGSADYRYFPEPDLPPFDSSEIDIEKLRLDVSEGEEARVAGLMEQGIPNSEAKVIVSNQMSLMFFKALQNCLDHNIWVTAAKAIVHKYFGFDITPIDLEKINEYAQLVVALEESKVTKAQFHNITLGIKKGEYTVADILEKVSSDVSDIQKIEIVIDMVLAEHPAEVNAYKEGKTALYGFFVGQVMKRTGGRANPQIINKILKEKL